MTPRLRLFLAALKGPRAMDEAESIVAGAAPGVARLGTDAVAALPDDALLLDVRSEREFAVSHLPGALRVDPGTTKGGFLSDFGSRAEGRCVVFYCAIGWRSSRLAERVGAALLDRGALSVADMSGGIFRWANEGRPLVKDGAMAEDVHPVGWPWGRLLVQREG
jgi:rhodanese-related sulfurtransferase